MSSTTGQISRILTRPRPPADLIGMGDYLAAPDRSLPALDLAAWIKAAWIDPSGPLHAREFAVLEFAKIGAVWTTAENTHQSRRILGQAEMPERSLSKLNKWQRARAYQQLQEWFGCLPHFILTFDALYADQASDREWCCLVEHELRHCAQATDGFGQPRYNRDTGEPVWTLRPHDLEAFAADAARYGVEAMGEEAVDFVIAAAKRPEISDTQIAQACGTRAPARGRAVA